MDKKSPIGVFDSGVGGLSVVKEIYRQLPEEDIIYFGDTAHVPYGSKKVEELIFFGDQITRFLLDEGAKIILVACNTSSSVSLNYLLDKFSVPVIGVIEPSIDLAIQSTTNKKIGVIATEATINSNAHKNLLLARDPNLEVYPQACPKFVPLVEKGITEGKEAYEAALEYLLPLKEKEIDTLILGCTHYPFLDKVIREVLGPEVKIIDPALETVWLTKKTLLANNLLNKGNKGKFKFWVSGDPESFYNTGKKFIGDILTNVRKITLK